MRDPGTDQATGLRRLFARDTLQVLSIRGTEESGATAITLDLARALVALGHRPLIIDLEGGQAALGLGLKPRYELAHVLRGDKALDDTLLLAGNGVAVLPAMRGFAPLAAGGNWIHALGALLGDRQPAFNVWLVNGGTGPVAESARALLVVAPTRAAITSAYGQIKSLARGHAQRQCGIVIDHAASETIAEAVYTSIAETCRRFLALRPEYCGFLPNREAHDANRNGAPRAGAADPTSPRAHAVSRLAAAVVAALPATPSFAELETGH
jgi:flagellar biosynthesis protein FlhG